MNTRRIDRTLLALSGAFFAAIAIWMFVWPRYFYLRVPGVAAAGPFDVHLLRDVAIAHATIATALSAATARLAFARHACAFAALYLLGHAALHARSETPGVVVPALVQAMLAVWFARKSESSPKIL